MFRSIRQRHVNATTIVAVIALVFAMTGGAWAAKRYLITSTSQISPKVLKALKGVSGKNGANGVSGATGPAGAGGSQGSQGPSGATGPQGPQGIPGEKGEKGEKGAKGLTGEPWTPNGQLPAKATETGAWAFGPINKPGAVANELVASFAIQLAAPLEGGGKCEGPKVSAECHVHFINVAGKEQTGVEGTELIDPKETGACLGSHENPTATSGNLCVYATELSNVEVTSSEFIQSAGGGEGAGKTGAILQMLLGPGTNAEGHGTWAVTG